MAEVIGTDAIARPSQRVGLLPLIGYFLKLGTVGFGGPQERRLSAIRVQCDVPHKYPNAGQAYDYD